MRVISNALVSLMTDKNLANEGKVSTSGAEKLMELLRGAPNGELTLEATLKGILEGKAKFNINNVGNIEIPVPVNSSLPESGSVSIRFSLQNEVISATILQGDSVDKSLVTSKTDEIANQLKQLGIPQTEQNMKAIQLLNEYHIEPSADKVKQLAEGSFLASKASEMAEGDAINKSLLTNDQKIDVSKTLKSIVIQWLGQQNSESVSSGTSFKSNVQETPELSQHNLISKPVLTIAPDNNSLQSKDMTIVGEGLQSAETAGDKSSTTLSQKDEISKTTHDVMSNNTAETLSDIKNLLKQLNPKQLLPLIASDSKLNMENLLLSDQVFSGSKNIGQLKESLVTKLSEVFSKLEPSKALIQEIINWVEEDPAELTFKEQLTQLETIIARHSPEAASEMKDSFEQINKSMDFVQQMQNQLIAFHIPLQLGEHHTQIEMYMNKRKGRQNQDEFKMFIALNTNEIGQVQVLITDQKLNVELQFKLETEELKTDFENERESLQEILENYSDKPIKLKFLTHSAEPAILEAFKSLREDQTTSIDMRV